MGDIYLFDEDLPRDNSRPRRSDSLIVQILRDIGSAPVNIKTKPSGFIVTLSWDHEVNFLLTSATRSLENNKLRAEVGFSTVPDRQLMIVDIPQAIYEANISQIKSSLQYENHVSVVRLTKFAGSTDKSATKYIKVTK